MNQPETLPQNLPARSTRQYFVPAIVAGFFGIALSVAAYLTVQNMQQNEAQKSFERAAKNYIEGLRARLNEALLLDPANENITTDAEFTALVDKQKSLIPVEGIDSKLLRATQLPQATENARVRNLLTYTDEVTLGNGRWSFFATPQPNYYQPRIWVALSVLAGGLATTALVAGYFYFMLRQRARDHAVMNEQNRLREQLELTIIDMEKAQAETIKAKEAAENANRAKSDFLATMSHEIRTPMNGILGMTELMLETEMTNKQNYYTITVMQSAEALLGIINDILDFSKIEAGKLDMEIVPLDLQQIVESAAELLSVRAREKSLEIVVQYIPGTPRYLMGDPVRIRQVICNLLGNAIKFTEKGYIILTVDSSLCPLNAPPDSSYIKISVTDTGIGISEEALTRIFEKFTQADTSTTRKFGGTGLGLSIAKQLADMMGGDIGVESTLGTGSTFWFSMALPNSNQEHDPLADFGASTSILRSVRLLMVDDLGINNTIIQGHLEQVGMQVGSCESAAEALAILREAKAAGDPYQMAIVDYLMPHMNGEELVRIIKSDPEICDIAIIMLTSSDGRGYLERFEKAGFSSLLSKPIRVQPLIETVATVWEMYKNGHKNGLIADDSFARRSHREVTEAHFHHANILLAEDDRVNQEFANEILTSFQCIVTIASNGIEAVRMATEQPFDLILMDCQMPQLDGFAASTQLAEMKKQGTLPNIPIIALTANALKGDRQRCLQAGMVDYATKPIRKEHLAKILYKWLPSQFIAPTREIASLSGIAVLLVEDNRINMEFAIEILEGFGCTVLTARNGLEALAIVKKEQPYDIILMDVQMPEMDGLTATRHLREMQNKGEIPTIPIIAVTANAMKGDREICLEAGMDDYLTKPLQSAQLKTLLLKWISPDKLIIKDVARTRRKQADSLLNEEIVLEARAVMGSEFTTVIRLFVKNTDFILDTIERCIRAERDPQAIVMHAHSLHSSSGYMGASRLSELAHDMEKMARNASSSHGDITKLWPIYEEMRFAWVTTREQLSSLEEQTLANAA